MKLLFYGYQLLLLLLIPPGLLVWGGFALRDARYRRHAGERLGLWAGLEPGPLWVHGASVGEVRAVAPLVRSLTARGERVLLTTTSPSGRDDAEALVGEQGWARLLPLDLALLLVPLFRRVRPRALVLVETELWPALLWTARRTGVPVLLVNGRISDNTLPRYGKIRPVMAAMFRVFHEIHAQSAQDAERLRALGASPGRVVTAGNMKFDLPAPDWDDPLVKGLRRAREGGLKLFVAGSTHPGEEEAVLEALSSLEKSSRRIGLVLAPRHLERLDEVEKTLRDAGRDWVRWSALGDGPNAVAALESGKALLVDCYGLLGRLYGGGDVAFVGGSMVPVGGHNLLEPLIWGVPVLFGPHMQNAADIRDAVIAHRLGREVADGETFAAALDSYLTDESLRRSVAEEVERFFAANRGSAQRALDALEAAGLLEAKGDDG